MSDIKPLNRTKKKHSHTCHSCPITSNHYTLRADARQGRCELYLAIAQECSQRRGGSIPLCVWCYCRISALKVKCIWLVWRHGQSTVRRHKRSTLFSGKYLRNYWTLDICVLGYIGIVWPKEHSPKVRSFPPGTPCIYIYIYIFPFIIYDNYLPKLFTSFYLPQIGGTGLVVAWH